MSWLRMDRARAALQLESRSPFKILINPQFAEELIFDENYLDTQEAQSPNLGEGLSEEVGYCCWAHGFKRIRVWSFQLWCVRFTALALGLSRGSRLIWRPP